MISVYLRLHRVRVYGAHRDLEVPGRLDGACASEGGFALTEPRRVPRLRDLRRLRDRLRLCGAVDRAELRQGRRGARRDRSSTEPMGIALGVWRHHLAMRISVFVCFCD